MQVAGAVDRWRGTRVAVAQPGLARDPTVARTRPVTRTRETGGAGLDWWRGDWTRWRDSGGAIQDVPQRRLQLGVAEVVPELLQTRRHGALAGHDNLRHLAV